MSFLELWQKPGENISESIKFLILEIIKKFEEIASKENDDEFPSKGESVWIDRIHLIKKQRK